MVVCFITTEYKVVFPFIILRHAYFWFRIPQGLTPAGICLCLCWNSDVIGFKAVYYENKGDETHRAAFYSDSCSVQKSSTE